MLASPAVAATAARLIQQRIPDGTLAAGGLLPSQRGLGEQPEQRGRDLGAFGSGMPVGQGHAAFVPRARRAGKRAGAISRLRRDKTHIQATLASLRDSE